jgi:hypothetical protein
MVLAAVFNNFENIGADLLIGPARVVADVDERGNGLAPNESEKLHPRFLAEI